MEHDRETTGDNRAGTMIRTSRRTRTCFFALLTALIAVTVGATYAQDDLGYYSQGVRGTVDQLSHLKQVETAVYKTDAYPLYTPELPFGKGRDAVEAYCSTCHSLRYITMQPPLPAQTWAAEVTKMVKVMGQAIPDDAQAQIIEYLQSHYTPETRKR